MTIDPALLYLALLDAEPWHPSATDWRKLPNGKIVRFVDWNWKAKRIQAMMPGDMPCNTPCGNAACPYCLEGHCTDNAPCDQQAEDD